MPVGTRSNLRNSLIVSYGAVSSDYFRYFSEGMVGLVTANFSRDIEQPSPSTPAMRE